MVPNIGLFILIGGRDRGDASHQHRQPRPPSEHVKLFIDFALSDQGQKIFIQRGRESAKAGLKPEGYPEYLKVFPSRVQLAEKLEEYGRLYRELFVH